MLRIRHFSRADDVVIPRFWVFYDALAAASGVDFRLHLAGDYPGPGEDLDRAYVTPIEYMSRKAEREVWVIKSWDHPSILAAAAIARVRGIPLVLWGERPGFTYEVEGIKSRIRVAARDTLYPAIFGLYAEPALLLGVGKGAAAAFGQLAHNRNVDELIYPSPVADDLLERPDRRSWGSPPLLLYVGSFCRRKGIDVLCDACRRAWMCGIKFDLRLVGDGTERPSAGEVHPFAKGEALLHHYDDADGLVLPSRHDGWGLVVHEAMARGIPVIVSDACGASQMVEDAGCGFIPMAGSIGHLAASITRWADLSDLERTEMGRAGRDLARRHTVADTVGRLVAFCEIHVDEMSRAAHGKAARAGVRGRDPRRV